MGIFRRGYEKSDFKINWIYFTGLKLIKFLDWIVLNNTIRIFINKKNPYNKKLF